MIEKKEYTKKQYKLIIRILVAIIILLMYIAGYYYSVWKLNEKKLQLINSDYKELFL